MGPQQAAAGRGESDAPGSILHTHPRSTYFYRRLEGAIKEERYKDAAQVQAEIKVRELAAIRQRDSGASKQPGAQAPALRVDGTVTQTIF